MTTAVAADHVAELVGYLHSRRTDLALALALGLADDGVPAAHLLTDLIGPAQVEVGERWYRNEYSIADEHAATSVTDTLVTLLAAHDGPATRSGPHVLAVCPEGEWHTLPLRIAAQVLELDEIEVSYLGASLPSEHLARFMARARPDAVVLTCSTPLAFGGVLATVEVAHQFGVPVIAGGRAWGGDSSRADVLGVDRWVSSAPAAPALVREAIGGPLRTPTADGSLAADLAADRLRLVDDAFEGLRRRFSLMAGYSAAQLRRTREDLTSFAQFAEASILVDDPRVFDEFLSWLSPLLTRRNVPRAAIDAALTALAESADGPRADLFGRRR